MIVIKRIYRTVLPIEAKIIAEVQEIFRNNFSAVADYADKIPDMLDNPIKYGYTTILFVSLNGNGSVTGFSLFNIFANIKSALLDFIAVKKTIRSGGVGGALYEATREYLKEEGVLGLFYECLPDDSKVVLDSQILKENQRRLNFYEVYGARPIIGTEYETPIDKSAAPYLVYDHLDTNKPLGRSQCRAVFRTILTKKYSHLVSLDYIERVVESVIDNPVKIREPKYKKIESQNNIYVKPQKPFVLVSSDSHHIHHVKDKGYVERPARVNAIKESLKSLNIFESLDAKSFGIDNILAVHDADFVKYLQNVCLKLNSKNPVYPYVFPIRRPDRKPKDLSVRAGYYCIDTFTPLDSNAYDAARSAVNVAMTAAEQLLQSRQVVYALCRPPGHHAEKRVFGGFCYFNNAAVAANYLSKNGKVAIIDIDFHHFNGTQDIFYQRNDVLTISLHGHPNIAYPYFSGFADESGEGQGKGFNINYPLAENIGSDKYLEVLQKAIGNIQKFNPNFLVVSLGFDIMNADPTGSFGLTNEAIKQIGFLLGMLNKPTIVVQEGGYSIRNLRTGAAAFFNGIAKSMANYKTINIKGK